MEPRLTVIVALTAAALALVGFIWYAQIYAPAPVVAPSAVAPR